MKHVDSRTKIDNLNHTHSKLGIFIENALSGDYKKDWKNGTGKLASAKKKYLQLYKEINTLTIDKRSLDQRIWDLIHDLAGMFEEKNKLNSKTWQNLLIYVPTKELWKMIFKRIFK